MEQITTIKILKKVIITTPVLVQLDYSKEARLIIFTIDRYKNGWGYGLI